MTFNQPSNQQPQPPNQQPGGYDFGDYNFSQQSPPQQPYGYYGGYSQPGPAPRKRSGARTCLLLAGCSALAVIAVCGCLIGLTYMFREIVTVSLWIEIASGDSTVTFEDAYELEIICADSDAETYTRAFELRYPDGATIELGDNTEFSSNDGAVSVLGTLTDNRTNETVPYEATFYISHDKGGLPLIGCIDSIDEIAPNPNPSVDPTVE